MKIAWAIIAIFGARFAAIAWHYRGQDADLSWQQWLGNQVLSLHRIPSQLGLETFTAPGAHWVAQEWLFSTAIAATISSWRFYVLAIAVALAAVCALAVTAWRAHRRGSSTFATTLTTALVGLAMMQSFGVRAQIFGWALLAIIMLLLDLESPLIFLIIPLTVVWANLHASALIVPALVGFWTLGTAVEDRAWTPRLERNVVLTVGTCLAVLLTPLSWHLPAYAVALQTSAIRSSISEWQPPDLTIPSFYAGLLPLIAMACFFGIAAPRERWRDGMLFAVMTVLAFTAIRHMSLCAIVIAPMVAQRLSSTIPLRARLNVVLSERFSEVLVLGSSAVAALLIILTLNQAPAVARSPLPNAAIARIAQTPGVHKLYCEDFAWCSMALSSKNIRVFLDGRCDPFPDSVWKAYLDIEKVTPRWSSALDAYGTDTVLAKAGRPLAQILRSQHGWHLFYRDKGFVVYVRNAPRA
ncbi:MAG TPA: hypothetical protein VGR69_09230 [Candidatus Rubrimentiphilum sp.]|nr:hypothetical protein [Candidatus Rubrimentiphilum sp.]